MPNPDPIQHARSTQPAEDRLRPLRRVQRGTIGAALALMGAAVLAGLVTFGQCGSAFCERASVTLGLALSGLNSAAAQALIPGGAWMLWTAIRCPGPRSGG